MSHEVLPGIFLEVVTTDGKITAVRLTKVPSSYRLPIDLQHEIEVFLDHWRHRTHRPIPDERFLFPDFPSPWTSLLLWLKNTVGPGETITYKTLGSPFNIHPRTVGMIMARNPFPLLIPCHRVVGTDGRLTGFSAEGGLDTKRRLLRFEGTIR